MPQFFKKIIWQEKSFTLIETLIVVAILATLMGTAFVEFASYKTRHSFDLDSESLVAALSNAQSKAVQQENGSAWGIRFTNGAQSNYAIFSGTTFSTSTVVTEEALSSVTTYTNPVSGSSTDIVFSKLTGTPILGGAASIAIKRNGGSGIYVITVSNSGKISKNLETGLVGYWPMDEGSGNYAYDTSGSSNVGTLVNSPTRQSGTNCRVGSCLGFDGISQYVQVNNSLSLNPSNLTVSVWAKSNTATWNDYGFLVSKRNVYIIHPTQGDTNVSFYIYASGWTSVGCYPSNITNWNLYTLTWNGTTLNCYVNGVLGGSNNPGGSINTADTGYLTIGRDDEVSRYFNGSEDDVRIYNRALSTTEVNNLYNSY